MSGAGGSLQQELGGCSAVARVILFALVAVVAIVLLVLVLLPALNPLIFDGSGQVDPDDGQAIGPGAADQVPAISEREFTSGSSALTVSGAFGLDPSVRFETGGDSDGQRAHIEYWVGVEALPDPSITLVMGGAGGEPNRIEVYSGEWSALDRGDGCTWQVTVTATTVSGHVSCPAIHAENLYDGSTGTVSVELDFVANSP